MTATVAALSVAFNDAAAVPPDDRPVIAGDVVRLVGDVRVHCFDGTDYLSASTVLRMSPYAALPDLTPAMLAWLAERGKAVHTLCQLEAAGELDAYDYDPRLAGYVAAWRAFRAATGFHPEAWEVLCRDEETHTFGYADVVGTDTEGARTVELKTADDVWTSHRLQVCCYCPQGRRAVLALHKDGTYDCVPTEPGDRAEYVALAYSAHQAIREREQMTVRRAARERLRRQQARRR